MIIIMNIITTFIIIIMIFFISIMTYLSWLYLVWFFSSLCFCILKACFSVVIFLPGWLSICRRFLGYPSWNQQFSPENRWLEDYFPSGMAYFQGGKMLVLGRVFPNQFRHWTLILWFCFCKRDALAAMVPVFCCIFFLGTGWDTVDGWKKSGEKINWGW